MKIAKPASVLSVRAILFMLIAMAVISCSKKPELSTHIPEDAGVVVTLDVKSMALKSLDFKEMFSLGNLKKVVGNLTEPGDSSKKSFGDPGLDFTSDIFIFGASSGQSKYGALIASLSDAKKFEDFIKQSDSSLTVKEEGNLKYASFAGEQGILGWNKDQVFAVFGTDKSKENLLAIANLKPEESLLSTNPSFKQSQEDGGDISLWLNYEAVMQWVPQYTTQLGDLNFKNTYVTAACNFEDGQVAVNMKYSTNAELAKKYNFIKSGVNGDVVKTLPGKSLIGLLSIALDMEKIYDQVEKAGLVTAYGQAANQFTGMEVKDLMTMLSGDLAITINGIEMKEVAGVDYMGQPVVRKQPFPDYSVVLGIASKDKQAKLLEQLAKTGLLTKSDKHYSFQDKVFVLEKGSTLVIAGTAARAKSLEEGGSDQLDAELASMVSSSATSFYFNLSNVPDNVYDSPATADKVKRTELETLEITSTTMKDSTSTGKLLIKFKNKKENALVTIVRVSKSFADELKQSPSPFGPPQIQPDTTVVAN